MQHEILPPQLAIKSMRSSGYRDAAHAVAELIDNSIQAGLDIPGTTNVEVLCVDRRATVSERTRARIHHVAVYDDACGMDADTLRMALQFGNGTRLHSRAKSGIGKFGMGLPNASISQCRKVEVWSWQDGRTLYTYLSLDEIERGGLREVPVPVEASVPHEWASRIKSTMRTHGTLVVWSDLDLVKWKSSRAFLKNAEFLVGRMYRYFIDDGRASIRLAAFEDDEAVAQLEPIDRFVRPNDPLYLMNHTSAPDVQPAFDLVHEEPLEVELKDGSKHTVQVRFSLAKQETRDLGGSSKLGRHAAKNIGVSVVRAERELEITPAFCIGYDPRERWWGVEVKFDPGLDEVFGVTNNKQAATALVNINLAEDAEKEGLTERDYRDLLMAESDPRLPIYELAHRIDKTLKKLRAQIKRMHRKEEKTADGGAGTRAEQIATRATEKRRAELARSGRSDSDEGRPDDERVHDLTEMLTDDETTAEEAAEIAVASVRSRLKYMFRPAKLRGGTFFDVVSSGGVLVVELNDSHPVYDHLYELLEASESAAETGAFEALKLLLTAWARMEDETTDDRRRELLEDVRVEWGKIARDFIRESDD